MKEPKAMSYPFEGWSKEEIESLCKKTREEMKRSHERVLREKILSKACSEINKFKLILESNIFHIVRKLSELHEEMYVGNINYDYLGPRVIDLILCVNKLKDGNFLEDK